MRVNYLFEYLPTRYSANETEKRNRVKVWNFKDGSCSEEVYLGLKQRIRNITGDSASQWVVVFAPASTASKTEIRYHSLATRLNSELSVYVYFDGFFNMSDRDIPACHGGTRGDVSNVGVNQSVFRGKKVLIIDDVVTSGRSLCALERKAIAAHANQELTPLC